MALMTKQEIADTLRISPDTVGELVKKQILPCIKLSRRTHRYDSAAVASALAGLQASSAKPTKGDRKK